MVANSRFRRQRSAMEDVSGSTDIYPGPGDLEYAAEISIQCRSDGHSIAAWVTDCSMSAPGRVSGGEVTDSRKLSARTRI